MHSMNIVPGTCSLYTLSSITGGGYGTAATVESIKGAIEGHANVIANTTNEKVSKNLIAAGLGLLGSYKGNGGTVYCHATFAKKEEKVVLATPKKASSFSKLIGKMRKK